MNNTPTTVDRSSRAASSNEYGMSGVNEQRLPAKGCNASRQAVWLKCHCLALLLSVGPDGKSTATTESLCDTLAASSDRNNIERFDSRSL